MDVTKPAQAAAPPPQPVRLAPVRIEDFLSPERGTFATVPADLRLKAPDRFQAVERALVAAWQAQHPGRSLLRQQTRDRSTFKYLEG